MDGPCLKLSYWFFNNISKTVEFSDKVFIHWAGPASKSTKKKQASSSQKLLLFTIFFPFVSSKHLKVNILKFRKIFLSGCRAEKFANRTQMQQKSPRGEQGKNPEIVYTYSQSVLSFLLSCLDKKKNNLNSPTITNLLNEIRYCIEKFF